MIPGVSERISWKSSPLTIPRIRCLVVCALEVMMESFSPTKAFINVDLPTLGFPIMFTKPALGSSFIFFQFLKIRFGCCIDLGCKVKYGNHVWDHHQGIGEIDQVLYQLQGSHSGKDDHQYKKYIVPFADLGIGQKPKALYPVIGIGEKRGQGKGGHDDHQKDAPIAIKGIVEGIQGHDDPTALLKVCPTENDDHRREATDQDGIDERAQHGYQTF